MGQEGTMSRAVLACAAAFLLLGCSKPDAVWWFLEPHDGAIGVTIAADDRGENDRNLILDWQRLPPPAR